MLAYYFLNRLGGEDKCCKRSVYICYIYRSVKLDLSGLFLNFEGVAVTKVMLLSRSYYSSHEMSHRWKYRLISPFSPQK